MVRVLTCIAAEHDWRLVLLAGVVCFLASLAAISLFNRARDMQGMPRVAALLSMGIATGSSIWVTHFIAMLAFQPGASFGYRIDLTAGSLLIAAAVTTAGLSLAVYGARLWTTIVGGMVVGAGIAGMHYTGIAAVEMTGAFIWIPELVVASVILGLAFGAAALVVAARSNSIRMTLLASGLLAFAILSHHFTGMAAAAIIPGALHEIDPNALSPASISLGIAAIATLVLVICLIGAWFDRRNRRWIKEQNRRLDAAVNNMVQGLCMFDAQNRLMLWNERYREMYKIEPRLIYRGCTISDLLDARAAAGTFALDPVRYEADLRNAVERGETFTMNVELPDGRLISVMTQPMVGGGWVATHEDVTERTRAERELQDTRTFLDTIIEHVPSPIIVKNARDRKYLLVNRAAEKYLGADRNTLIGKTAADIMPASTADMIEQEDLHLIRSGQMNFHDEHIIETPGNGPRVVTAMRLPVFGSDGAAQYLISLIQDLTDRKRDEQRIAHMAAHDPLTDLPNRAAFNQCLASTVTMATQSEENFAVLCIDLDRFKSVNDVYGHAVGDALLRQVAWQMAAVAQGAFVARIGGDEFAIVTPTGPHPATAEALAERLSEAFASDIVVEGHALRVGLTIGIGIYPQDGADAATLATNADAALSRAKSEARGSIRFFEMAMDNQLREKRLLQQDLRSALLRDELALFYQPQARIDGHIVGFEALVRWHHPRHGLVPPSTFIPLAEEIGMIIAMGEWVLREACREAASWPQPLEIAVNLSPAQFQHGDLPRVVHQILLETGLSPSRLTLEITEGVLIGDFNSAVMVLRRLKNLGVRIAMDDFGTGYSSLSYLQSFPFDKIKIDQTFIANLGNSEQAATIVRAVIALSRGLNLPVVAEGVETVEQLNFLAQERCNEIQGYYIGRPLPIADYAELVGRPAAGRSNIITFAASA